MKKYKRIPRIIKINKVKGHQVHCAFNNGEYRIIDFAKLFALWGIKEGDFEYPLSELKHFQKVKLCSGTLCWPHLTKKVVVPDHEFEAYLDFDPIVLYENSQPDKTADQNGQIGKLLKEARLKAGLTQEQLAIRSGTTKNYISRIENNRSDIELRTLRKIIEIGLDRKLEIAVN